MTGTRRSRLQRHLRTLLVLVAAGFLARAVVNAWQELGSDRILPGPLAASVAVGLWSAGLLIAARSWAHLLSATRRSEHAAGFLVSQLGKYIPGSVWQAAGQLGLARQAGVGLDRAGTVFSVYAITQVVAGATLTVGLVAAPEAPGAARVAALAGLGLIALLDRRWMVAVLGRIRRFRTTAPALVPEQGAILTASITNLASLATHCAAFAVLLGAVSPNEAPWLAATAQAAAWTAGFLVFPLPAGLGVRELVLVGLLAGSFPGNVVIAASLLHRFASMLAEALLAVVGLVWLKVARVRHGKAGAEGRSDD